MQANDREHQLDDDTATRPESGDTRPQQTPVIRMLANPRRVRRA